MKRKRVMLPLLLIILASILGAISAQSNSNLDVSLNEPAPFPERM